MRTHRLARIPGDGIGVDVPNAARAVDEAAAGRHGFAIAAQSLDWSCARYLQTGAMMSADGIVTLRGLDAIYPGAAVQGGPGFAVSATVCPDGSGPSSFEPVHGSAFDIAGRGVANPIAAAIPAALESQP